MANIKLPTSFFFFNQEGLKKKFLKRQGILILKVRMDIVSD